MSDSETGRSPQAAPNPDAYRHYNPINLDNTPGLVFMFLIALILLIALLRSEARNRALQAELASG